MRVRSGFALPLQRRRSPLSFCLLSAARVYSYRLGPSEPYSDYRPRPTKWLSSSGYAGSI